MKKKEAKINLRCPKCTSRTIYTRILKNDRVCRHCGFAGPKSAFVYTPPKLKKTDDKVPLP